MVRLRRCRQIGCVAAATFMPAGLAGCSSPAGTSTATTSTPSSRGAAPTDLPTSCTSKPALAPVSPLPTWPSGSRILDAVPSALSSEYPTVFGGVVVAPATPGEPMVEVNSHLVVLETVRDRQLEAEARSAYPKGITITFAVTPRSKACLDDVNVLVGKQWNAAATSGVTVYSSGIGRAHVMVGVAACTASTEQSAKEWFSRRWGDVVSVDTCQKPAIAAPATVR